MMNQKGFDTDYLNASASSTAQPRSNPAMMDTTLNRDNTTFDASQVTSPTVHRVPTAPNSANTLLAQQQQQQQQQQFALQGSPLDYPDAQTLDFLNTLGAANNGGGDFVSPGIGDQAHLDLGFGMNWEGLANDYSEGQQMNPFDAFFFGGQQPGQGQGSDGTNGGGGGCGGMGL